MKIACCQLDIAWENKAANHARVRNLVAKERLPRGSFLLLPEMFSTGFSFNIPAIAEGSERETEKFCAALALEFGLYVNAGIVVAGPAGKALNQSLLVGPDGKELARYSKLQPFSLSGESQHYGPGENISLVDVDGFKLAPFVCYDLRFPEIFRAAARNGAQLITVMANWPLPRDQHWITLLRARAIENQAYVAGCNRAGADPRYVYFGRSVIVDPHGTVIAEAGDKECIISADIDVQTVVNWRKDFPALSDMRDDFFPR